MKTSLRLMLIAAGVCLASACSHLPELAQMSSRHTSEATPGLAPRERVRLAVELLDGGDAARAELELRAALQEQPGNRAAQRLLAQITDDPSTLIGDNAHPYTVRAGETMSELADRFLGDPLLFYALARYNELEAPNQLSAGQRLMIPYRPGVAVVSGPTPGPGAPTSGPAALRGAGDPDRANQLRLQGLQQLNTGNVDAAITLLRQAQALDSGNPAIQRDIDRAMRLQAALAAGPG